MVFIQHQIAIYKHLKGLLFTSLQTYVVSGNGIRILHTIFSIFYLLAQTRNRWNRPKIIEQLNIHFQLTLADRWWWQSQKQKRQKLIEYLWIFAVLLTSHDELTQRKDKQRNDESERDKLTWEKPWKIIKNYNNYLSRLKNIYLDCQYLVDKKKNVWEWISKIRMKFRL